MKDIGKVILDRFVADSFRQIDDYIRNEGLSFNEAEKKSIGIDHAELGALVAKKWKLSPKMVYIIKNHHMSDESAKQDFETSVVYLSDTLCMMMGIGGGVDGLAYRFYDDVLKRLNITEIDFQAIMADFGENMQKLTNCWKCVNEKHDEIDGIFPTAAFTTRTIWGRNGKKHKVLVVDDSAIVRKVLPKNCRRKGALKSWVRLRIPMSQGIRF